MLRKYKERARYLQSTMTPEQYKDSQDRLNVLSEMIKDGQKAEVVLEFANEVLEDVKEETLKKLQAPQNNLNEIQGYYKGACLFIEKLKEIITIGEAKRKKLNEIKKGKQGGITNG